ncbi:hypothetical protein F5B22DRAFT_585449 [Xylaria bambusicola]|uniref:uncharacterized protein n=1 Tax=Xylaria bambusicola TaxID=326684 RepID=UPI0020082E9C|nr:uncharacterized protein F5B22DRAFT_585449 [Xylaria bambusicola]KAI0526360.1 hypothetical protein F5B22DRAFT_585449 [Xylaria bambusicola]
MHVQPRGELFRSSNFRAPIDDGELDIYDPTRPYSFPQGVAYMGVPVAGVPQRSLSFSAPSFVQPQWSGTQQYAHSPTYDIQSTIPSPATNYNQQQMVSTYPYEVSPYGQSRPSNYGAMVQNRRHSAIPNANSAAHMTYSAAMVPNGTIAIDHSLSTHTFGDMFNASTPNATVESASASGGGGYETSEVISQQNGVHGMSASLPQGAAGFENQLSNGYSHSMNRLPMSEYVQASGGPAYGSASNSTTPTNLTMALESTDLTPRDEDWGRADSLLPKNEGDY